MEGLLTSINEGLVALQPARRVTSAFGLVGVVTVPCGGPGVCYVATQKTGKMAPKKIPVREKTGNL